MSRIARGRLGRIYDDAFYAVQAARSRRSAEVVVPLAIRLAEPRSVLDVGCGTGGWLRVFREHGVEDVFGVEGGAVPEERLQVPRDRFAHRDVAEPLDLGRTFDLVLCLEVAEHLPPDAAETLVASLARHGPLVLFSAAIPDQRGTDHVNEQWPSYWAKQFARHGYVPVDCIRRKIWRHPDVQWWYAQNTLLYVRGDELELRPALNAEHELMGTEQLDLVHPERYLKWRTGLANRVRRLLA